MKGKLNLQQLELLESIVSCFPNLINLCKRMREGELKLAVLSLEERELLADQLISVLLEQGLDLNDEPNEFGRKVDDLVGILLYNPDLE